MIISVEILESFDRRLYDFDVILGVIQTFESATITLYQ